MASEIRDEERERKERERFIVLLHVYTVTAHEWSAVTVERIASALALAYDEARAILDLLLLHSYVVPVGGGTGVVVGKRGAEYIERLAGRRRSLRIR